MKQLEVKKTRIIQITIAIIGVLGISIYNDKTNDFLYLILLVILVYMAKKLKPSKSTIISSTCFSVFLASILTLGKQLDLEGVIFWNGSTIIKIITLSCAVFLPSCWIMGRLSSNKKVKHTKLTKGQKTIVFGIIFVSNFILWLALYPGIYGWDSSAQAYQFFNGGLTSHWSTLLGFIFTRILLLGEAIFGNLGAGVAMATFLQMVVMSLIYARITFFINEVLKNTKIAIATVLAFIFILPYGLMTVYTTQDTIFGGLFVLVFIELYKFSINTNYWKNPKNALVFVVMASLMCLCRNNGVYVIIFVAIAILIFSKQHRVKFTAIILAPITFSFIFSGIVLNILSIPKVDTLNEMMSIPSQQIARTYNKSEKLTTDEKESIEYYYDNPPKLLLYDQYPLIADRTKETLNADKVKESPFGYLSLWLRLGIKHPRTYIEAFLLNTLGTWYPNKYYYDPRAHLSFIEYRMSTLPTDDEQYAEMQVNRESKLPLLEKALSQLILEDKWQEIPLLSPLYTIGTHFIIVVFVIVVSIKDRRKYMIVPLSIVIGLYITILLGPVSVYRYCYPIALTTPILLATLCCRKTPRCPC